MTLPAPFRFVVLIFVFLVTVASAQTTWTGSSETDGNWSTSENWSGNTSPANNGTATLTFTSAPTGAYGRDPVIDTPWSVSGLILPAVVRPIISPDQP